MEKAVELLLEKLERVADAKAPPAPAPKMVRKLFDAAVDKQGGSVRLACAFLAAYAAIDAEWDYTSVPVGIRGKYGDKRLANELTLRHVTFHNAITAFGENLGWKGNVRNVDLSTDPRFNTFLTGLKALSATDKQGLVDYIAWQLHSSIVEPKALPPLPAEYLTYPRSLLLCERLLALKTEGHVQQFLVAAFLTIHRRRYGHAIVTHHPHAADKYDGTVGDVEEYRATSLVGAFEVTVRYDWKNRLSDLQAKAIKGKLAKYVVIASDVKRDASLMSASALITFTSGLAIDLAVVDIHDFFCVFCAELTQQELIEAFNLAYGMLADPKLSGRADFLEQYKEVTDEWLEGA